MHFWLCVWFKGSWRASWTEPGRAKGSRSSRQIWLWSSSRNRWSSALRRPTLKWNSRFEIHTPTNVNKNVIYRAGWQVVVSIITGFLSYAFIVYILVIIPMLQSSFFVFPCVQLYRHTYPLLPSFMFALLQTEQAVWQVVRRTEPAHRCNRTLSWPHSVSSYVFLSISLPHSSLHLRCSYPEISMLEPRAL